MVAAPEPSPLEIAVRKVMDETDSEVILYSGPIEEAGFGKLVRLMPSVLSAKRGCILILVTYGGLAGPAYRMARLMQDLFNPFTVLVPGPCKSAGTLLATGAHRIAFFPHSGELGPLDVQLYKRDEIGERRSGLVTSSAIESLGQHAFELFSHFMLETKMRGSGLVRFRTATDIAGTVVTSLFGRIYEKVDPDTLGEEHRDTLVAFEYARRLARKGCNITESKIHQLVYGYPSHDFVIDYAEASTIFKDAGRTTPAMGEMVSALGVEVMSPSPELIVRRLSPAPAAEDAKEEPRDEEEDGSERTGPNGAEQPTRQLGRRGRAARKGDRGEGEGGRGGPDPSPPDAPAG
jgi:hypothetical protein